jgi:hypothetical protein
LTAVLTSKKRGEFAVCVANEGYDDLEVWMVYQVLSGAKAARSGLSSSDRRVWRGLLYPADRFAAVDFSKSVRSRLPRWQPSNGNKARQSAVKSKPRLSA